MPAFAPHPHSRLLPLPCVYLVGAGIVGRAIAEVHVAHGLDLLLADANEATLESAAKALRLIHPEHQTIVVPPMLPGLYSVWMGNGEPRAPEIVIESITENLSAKQVLFTAARKSLGSEVILASNTSNLRINELFSPLGNDSRCCGLHFFMPVASRPLVECIASSATSQETIQRCTELATAIGKETLRAGDSPGFVVNRMLAPYLNQSLLLLGQGVSAELLEQAALEFGMPLSPLRLIDTIGVRTAFDTGRVFWQSFPHRIDPAPILPGMIKAGRLGALHGGGFYDYPLGSEVGVFPGLNLPDSKPDLRAGQRANVLSTSNDQGRKRNDYELSCEAAMVVAKYERDRRVWDISDVVTRLAVPIWIEAAELVATGVVETNEAIELALRGGLGYRRNGGFFGFIEQIGSERMIQLFEQEGTLNRAFKVPEGLLSELQRHDSPLRGMEAYVEVNRRIQD